MNNLTKFNNSTIIPKDFIGDPLIEDNKHPEYLWLLSFDLIVFVFLTWLSYNASKKEQKKPLSHMHFQDFKAKFIQGLVISNGIRSISLLIIILTSNDTGDNATAWINYVAHAIPAFCFVSAYMCLVIFFADTYFSTASYNNHLVKPALFMLAISCYVIVALMALITFIFRKYKAFAYASEFMIGFVYAIIGVMTIYYGQQVSYVFESKSIEDYAGNKETSNKLLFMSISIGVLFLIKSLFGLITAFGAFDDLYPVIIGPNPWDFFMFLITEIAPTTIFIIVGKKKTKQIKNSYEQGI